MVVNGLDEYISLKCEQCIQTVAINSKPGTCYVVDGCSFVSHIIKQTSWVFGGQWKEIKDYVEKFVLSIEEEGCDLIFVMPHWPDAMTPLQLQNIRMGIEFVSINKKLPALDFYHNPPGAHFYVSQVLKARSRYEVVCTVSDFEFEAAALAKQRNCAGIMSDNNEFLALNGVPYFRLSSLNFEKHTINTVDRFILMKNLGLKVENVSLLSCLMGNALVPPQMLLTFHRKLQSGMQLSGRNPVIDIMPRICMYARPQSIQFSMLARTALSDESQKDFLETVLGRYQLSSVSDNWKPYRPVGENLVTYNNPQIHEDAVQRQISSDDIAFLHGVLTNKSYEQGFTLEDRPLTCAFQLNRPLRKLCYDIILGKNGSVCEKHISEKPEVEIVKCQEFRMNERTVKLEDLRKSDDWALRWAVFVKCANVTFNENVARELPSQFLGLCAILNYWWHSPLIQLAQWQLNAFLAQAVSQYAENIASLRRVLVTVVDSRAITFATLLARGAEALLQIASVARLPLGPFFPSNYFDGKLFSFYYYLSSRGTTIEKLCDDIPERVEMFKFLMMVIQSDSLVIEDKAKAESAITSGKSQVAKTTSLSIVPEYEEISDDEDDVANVDTEPVSDDEHGTIVKGADRDATILLNYDGRSECDAAQTLQKSEYGAKLSGVTEKSLPISRNDSTSSTIEDLKQLQVFSPPLDPRVRFPSFPGSHGETSTKAETTDHTLFPMNWNEVTETEAGTKPADDTANDSSDFYVPEPLPPGFDTVQPLSRSVNGKESESKLSIPLPPLPEPPHGASYSSFTDHQWSTERIFAPVYNESLIEKNGRDREEQLPQVRNIPKASSDAESTLHPMKRQRSSEGS